MIAIACPQCGKEFEADAVSVLTPDSPHLKALLEGTLNCTACPQCGSHLNIPCRLIYRDAENPYMLIQERRPPTREGLQKLVQNVEAAATQAAMSQGLERPELRMVFARPEFIEKLFLHQRGYDDRIVEYAKYQLLGNTEGLDPAKHRLHYDFSHDDGQLLHFIVFSRKGHRPVRMLQVPMEEYRALAAEFDQSPEARAELERAFPGCLVDVDHFFEA